MKQKRDRLNDESRLSRFTTHVVLIFASFLAFGPFVWMFLTVQLVLPKAFIHAVTNGEACVPCCWAISCSMAMILDAPYKKVLSFR